MNGKAINFALSAEVEMCKLGLDCENPYSLCKSTQGALFLNCGWNLFHLSNDTKITDVYRF